MVHWYAKIQPKAPFDGSTMTWFQKRLMPGVLPERKVYIIGRQKRKDGHHDNHDSGAGSDSNGEGNTKVKSKGTLILDATYAPANIKFPTDIYLLNAGRKSMEEIIVDLHTVVADGEKTLGHTKIKKGKSICGLLETESQQSRLFERC